jgi:hypothetical protein
MSRLLDDPRRHSVGEAAVADRRADGVAFCVLHDDLGGGAVRQLRQGDDLFRRKGRPEADADRERSRDGDHRCVGLEDLVVGLDAYTRSAPVDRSYPATNTDIKPFCEPFGQEVVSADDAVRIAAVCELPLELGRVGVTQ